MQKSRLTFTYRRLALFRVFKELQKSELLIFLFSGSTKDSHIFYFFRSRYSSSSSVSPREMASMFICILSGLEVLTTAKVLTGCP